ncbi:VOC family protein [Nocardioides salarius]|uniref:VOC family protein n=1 Tax=Nocardioides salarius TaxID=374513 RepID=UPI0030FBC041
MPVSAVRLNHAVLFVADLERSLDFYRAAFAMEVVAREPRADAAFLRLPRSGNHHDLGLFGVGAQPPRPRGAIGLYHLAWQVDTIEDLEAARTTLAELGALTGESSHGATKSVYAADPDGNEFEVMWMLPKAQWGAYEDAAPVERLDLPGEVRRWGGVRTAGELVPRDAQPPSVGPAPALRVRAAPTDVAYTRSDGVARRRPTGPDGPRRARETT